MSDPLFWAKVDKHGPEARPGLGPCWLWTGFVRDGYGRLCRSVGSKSRVQNAHRYCWQMLRGPISDGLHVLHRCDVRNCVNPAHLFLGTDADNVADMVSKGRQARLIGYLNGHASLTARHVVSIRERHAAGEALAALSREFGVGRSELEEIVTGAAWMNVGGTIRRKAPPTARRLTLNGTTLNIKQWAKRLGIRKETISRRLREGWPLELVLSRDRWQHRAAGKLGSRMVAA